MHDHPSWLWTVFFATLGILLVIDLLAHRGGREVSRKAAIVWSVIWIGAGLAFSGVVYFAMGSRATGEYLAAWLIEKTLSVDNLFVFLLVFQSLSIPEDRQRRVLTWGIFGALVFRALFIGLGAAAIERFHWVTYLFAALLLFAAWRVFREDPARENESKSVKWLSRHLPVSHQTHHGEFFARENGRRVVTPLFIALVAIELTDIVFAIDSVPAAFAVTLDRFILYSSNAFAILGLRSLYAVLAHGLARLRYLHYGLAAVLAFAAAKILLQDVGKLPPWASITIILAIMTASIWASLRAPPVPIEPTQTPDVHPGAGTERPDTRPLEPLRSDRR